MQTTKKRLQTGDKLGPQKRSVALINTSTKPGKRTVAGLDDAARTLTLTFSSEAPVERWYGDEVLSHAPGSPDLSRLNDGAPLLFNHNFDDILGVVESASIGPDRRGHAVVRFANTPRGNEMMGLVADSIVRNVSFMYRASDFSATDIDPDGDDDATYTANRWTAYEISLVSVPEDQSVGVGRAASTTEQPVTVAYTARANASPSAAAEHQPQGPTMTRNMHPLQNVADAQRTVGGGTTATTLQEPALPNYDDIRRQERERQNGIRALGERWSQPDLANLMIEGGATIETARAQFLEALDKNQPRQTPLGAKVDMTQAERKAFSLIAAIRALHSGDWKHAGFEREVSTEIARQLGRDSGQGFFVPTDLPFAPTQEHARAWNMVGNGKFAQRSPFAVGATATGGAMVATQLLADNWIEVLRNAMVTPILGARFLTGLVGKVDIPRQITATATSWVGELTAGNESEATFDKVSLTPKNITSWGVISRMMLLQSTPAIEMIARADLIAQIGLGLDLAALSGTGTGGQPTGIINQSGVGSVIGGTNGASLTFDHLIQLYSAPRVANVQQANLGFAFNAKAYGYLATLKATTGQYLWDPQGGLANASPDKVKGYPYAVSNQLRYNLTKGTSSGTCSELIYGNWQELLIAEWGALEIAINPYDSTYFKSGDVVIRAIQTADVGVRHGASFAVMSDALTPGF